jgi:site-specific DNA-adenine methylase
MFSYYGSKSKIVDYYPPPKYGKIIEPFAGSARYSLKYFDRDILLVDKYEIVIKTWLWLQQCSKQDILKLPDIRKLGVGFDLRNLNLTEGELYFLGFNAGIASTSPRYKISLFAGKQNGMKTYLKRISDNIYKIKHWQIRLGSFDEIQNYEATWFIDPPYQVGGYAYKENLIDYDMLSTWSKNRIGQVIVCENTKANWMDFKPMKELAGSMFRTEEAFWSNIPTNYDHVQQKIIF